MAHRPERLGARTAGRTMNTQTRENHQFGQTASARGRNASVGMAEAEIARAAGFLAELCLEIDTTLDPTTPNPHLNMMLHLLKGHLEGRRVSSSSMAAASGVPYATAMRKLADLQKAGLVEQRPRTKSGRSFSLHPSAALLERFGQLSSRISRIAREIFGEAEADVDDYFYGGSYVTGQAAIAPPTALLSPLTLGGGLRILVHGDPTFMVMENLKRQFEHIVGTDIHQRAFSIDRLRQEACAMRAQALRLRPDRGRSALAGGVRDKGRHPRAARHHGHRPAGSGRFPHRRLARDPLGRRALWRAQPDHARTSVLSKGLVRARGNCAAGDQRGRDRGGPAFPRTERGRYGVAWNAARGTALGHTFMMTCAAFGQPIIDLPRNRAATRPTSWAAATTRRCSTPTGRWRRRIT
jgi:multiple sugar transport system substrate-binding protein